jgi:hypothetical protein
MKAKEKPRQVGWRMYKRQRRTVRSLSRKLHISEAEVVREMINLYEAALPDNHGLGQPKKVTLPA